MIIKFTKMQGTGNDFVVLDGINQTIDLDEKKIRLLADRHFGVGCDQVLLVERSSAKNVDFRYRIFNADGGEVEQCGNGARCFARFVRSKGMTSKSKICVETNAGLIILHELDDGQVRVDMGVPRFEPIDIPLNATKRETRYKLMTNDQVLEFGAVSLGNPHGVFEVSDVDTAEVATLGPLLESHTYFPARANIGFMQKLSRSKIKLRVYERGSGETLACGTGACAAMIVGHLWGKLDDVVMVSLPGGDLTIEWQGEGTSVFLSGPANFVFEGEYRLS